MGPVRAELLKTWRSWATRVLLIVLVAVQLLLGYVLIWAILQSPEVDDGDFGPAARAALLFTLGTDQIVGNAVGMLAGLGGALAVVLGALTAAREYGWRTMQALLVQGRGRLALVAAKAGALAVTLLVFTLAAFATAAAGSILVMRLEELEVTAPDLGEVAAGIAVGWLVLGAWGAVGLALGFWLRGTGLAIGLGLVYAFVLEPILSALVGLSSILETIARGLIGVNAGALAASFSIDLPAELGGSPFDVEPIVATLVLVGYLAGGLALASVLVRARDVT